MRLGILSDTHDNLDALAAFLKLFRKKKVEHILHAGDWCSPFTIALLQKAGIPFLGVFGNNDGDRIMLDRVSQGRLHRSGVNLELGNWKTVVLHEPDNLEALAAADCFDLVIHGHDHRARIDRSGRTMVIDPGEACGWVSGKPTAATVDTKTGRAQIIAL